MRSRHPDPSPASAGCEGDKDIDLTTPEGMTSLTKLVLREEFQRFCDLQRQLVTRIEDDVLREQMEGALSRLEVSGR